MYVWCGGFWGGLCHGFVGGLWFSLTFNDVSLISIDFLLSHWFFFDFHAFVFDVHWVSLTFHWVSLMFIDFLWFLLGIRINDLKKRKWKNEVEKSSQKDSQGSVSPLWVRIISLWLQIGTGESKIGIQKNWQKTKSAKTGQKDSQGSVSPLRVRIISLWLQIGTGEAKLAFRKKSREVARKTRKGRFPPSGFVLTSFCFRSVWENPKLAFRKKSRSAKSGQKDSQESVFPLGSYYFWFAPDPPRKSNTGHLEKNTWKNEIKEKLQERFARVGFPPLGSYYSPFASDLHRSSQKWRFGEVAPSAVFSRMGSSF